jgi:hypothetical protein
MLIFEKFADTPFDVLIVIKLKTADSAYRLFRKDSDP